MFLNGNTHRILILCLHFSKSIFVLEIFRRSDDVQQSESSEWKIFISSSTNVAVDRILLSLIVRFTCHTFHLIFWKNIWRSLSLQHVTLWIQDQGFNDFIRVGSAKRMAPKILPYSTHGSKSDKSELKDLRQMLKDPSVSKDEKLCIQESIEKVHGCKLL